MIITFSSDQSGNLSTVKKIRQDILPFILDLHVTFLQKHLTKLASVASQLDNRKTAS
jgi:hypothetical protein